MELFIKRKKENNSFCYMEQTESINNFDKELRIDENLETAIGMINNKDCCMNVLEHLEIETNNIQKDMHCEVATFKIGEEKGTIMFHSEKKDTYNGIYYWEVNYKGCSYELYEVGLGSEGIYLCIWSDEKMYGTVSKVRAGDYDEYKSYGLNTSDPELIYLFTVYWDIIRFAPIKGRTEIKVLNTCQESIRKKYMHYFIPYVKKADKLVNPTSFEPMDYSECFDL